MMAYSFFTLPYGWIFLCWSGVSALFVYRCTNRTSRILALNVAMVLLGLAAGEVYFWLVNPGVGIGHGDEVTNSAGAPMQRMRSDPLYGWAPSRPGTVHWKRSMDGEVIFDVTYEIDENGLRVSNAHPGGGGSECILFFGGSFTFGAGVADSDSMPHLVDSLLPEKRRVYNFGFSGYGAHHMLAAIDHGRVAAAIECEPRYVIYQAIPDHVRRSANRTPWGTPGPKYVLDGAQVPTYVGQLNVPPRPNRKSEIFRAIVDLRIRQADLDLLAAIINQARVQFEAQYPGVQFHVLFWNDPNDANSESLLSRLREKGVRIHLVSDILPGLHENQESYWLSPLDRHPAPHSHRGIAEYVDRQILQRK